MKVYRKASPNNMVCIYLFSRDFIDNATAPPVIDGVIRVDPNYCADRNAYMQMALIFGRKEGDKSEGDLDHQFTTKTLYLDCHQVYPVTRDVKPSKQQEDLLCKLGSFAYPFRLEFPMLGGPSYQMMQGKADAQGMLGLEYEVMAFVGKDEWDEHKRSTSRLSVWRIQGLPPTLNFDCPKPKGHKTKSFITYSGSMHIDVLLNKKVYKTEEQITVYVNVKNICNKDIKELKIKLVQRNQIPMFIHDGVHDYTLQKIEDKVNISKGGDLTREYILTTIPPPQKSVDAFWKFGKVMLEGTIGRDGKEVLAASTHINHAIHKSDIFGIYVEYVIKVKATFGHHIPGYAICEVPIIITQKQQGSAPL